MKNIKKRIIRFINHLLFHTELTERINTLERKLNRISNLNYLIIPDVLPFSKKAERIFQYIKPDTIYLNVNVLCY
jgi:hypothetical protein